jgi:hypothetical protein
MILLTPNLFLNIFSIFFGNLIQINPFIHILFKIFTRFSLAWTAAISLVGNLQIRKKILKRSRKQRYKPFKSNLKQYNNI